MLVFDCINCTVRNPKTNDLWFFEDSIEAKTFIDAFYAEDVRCIINHDSKERASC